MVMTSLKFTDTDCTAPFMNKQVEDIEVRSTYARRFDSGHSVSYLFQI